jgi:uncharacterized protein (TIGR02145 family)
VNLVSLGSFAPLPETNKSTAAGMVVYNEAHVNDEVYPGIYVWDGAKWGRINDGTPPPPMPSMATPSITKSGEECGNGVLYYIIPEDYPDWDNTDNFVWELTSPSPSDYKPFTVTSGSKNSYFFVPYDATPRDYSVSVIAEGSKSPSMKATTAPQVGCNNATNNFFISGNDCYDIKQKDYAPDISYGVMVGRTRLETETDYTYVVKGSGTVTSYSWTVSDPGGILLNPPAPTDEASIDIQFKQDVLSDVWLVAQPEHEHIVVLTCVVTTSTCTYIATKEIKVGDRGCCLPVTDIDGNIYMAHRFGDAGCWMTENLAVTRNQKRGSAANLIYETPSTEFAPRYTFPAEGATASESGTPISLEDARDSNFYGGNEGKPGLLYNWAAAIGAPTGSTTNNSGGARDQKTYPNQTNETSTNAASRDESKNEDICPVGWYLPSDAEWSKLEEEISAHPSDYSTETVPSTWSEDYAKFRGTHGSMMRNPKNPSGNYTQLPEGVSNSKESGFSGLLVGYAISYGQRYYGSYVHYWSSSSNSMLYAWSRYLYHNNEGVYRYQDAKNAMHSVRCKKLELD